MNPAPKLTEAEFMDQVVELAELRGWLYVHFRPGRTEHGWRTPVSGPLGKGWPDLVLLHHGKRRAIFAELKADGKQPDRFQDWVLEQLEWAFSGSNAEVQVWHPSEWDYIERSLR